MIQKGNLSIADYFDKVKVLGDTLSIAGHPIDESDLIMHLLNGLGPEYDPVVVHATSLVDDLRSNQSSLFFSLMKVGWKGITPLEINHQSPLPISLNPRSNGRGYPSNRLVCQVCHKLGHTASVCHYRFDKNFQPPTRANNHVATGMEHLENETPYLGSDSLAVGNGKQLQISHLDTTAVVSNSCTNSTINKDSNFHNTDLPFTALTVTSSQDINIWHSKLVYPGPNTLSKIMSKINYKGTFKQLKFCDACKIGKSQKLPYPVSTSRASVPLELVHTDLRGPSHISSKEGYRYFIHFLDDFSRFTWIFPLTLKSQAYPTFLQFKSLVEKQFSLPIKKVQSDWGGEYRRFASFLAFNGVQLQHSCPHDHEQNGRAERKHRHINEIGMTLLVQAGLDLSNWWLAFQHATFVINRLPTPVLDNISPY
uniref:Integrase catalytic domain-containing protein n=1 Tax=Cannabis sativa TaxID=3483 RepID=A0A803NLQ8_CANSA